MNFSSKTINKQAKEILIKQGLKFTPVPGTNLTELRADIRKFCRKLRLIEFFADKEESSDDISLAKPETDFIPERHRDPVLDTYIDYLSNYPPEELTKESKNAKFNLNKDEML